MKITIVTVSYNSASTIGDTIRSVADQTYSNIEHLVIDGCSTDDTLQVVERNRHPNLIVYSESDGGIYDAMNKGLSRASGEIVGFLNSDDLFQDSSVLEKIADGFNDKTIEACFGDLVYVTRNNVRVVRYWKSKPFVKESFSIGWSPAHPTFYIRQSALKRLGFFDKSFKLAADFELMMRYLEFGCVKSIYIPQVLVRMRVGGKTNQSLGNIFMQNKEIFSAFRKNNLRFSYFYFWCYKISNRLWQYLSGIKIGQHND